MKPLLYLSSFSPFKFVDFQKIVIRATDGGTEPGPRFTDTTLNVLFVPITGDPVFEPNTYDVAFVGEY